MNWLQRALGSLMGSSPPQVPAVQALGQGATFASLDDPNLASFLLEGRLTSSGKWVNKQQALTNATLFRAFSLICGAIGMLPIHLFETVEQGQDGRPDVVRKAKGHHLFRLLHKRPNDYQTALEFKTQLQADLLFEGRAYAYAPRNARGIIQRLVPLQAARVQPFFTDDFRLFFRYNRPKGGQQIIPAVDMFHMRSPLTLDGVNGVSLLMVAAEALGLADAAAEAQGSIFKNGAIVGGVLEHPKTLSAPAIERLRQQFEERHSGPQNAGKWIVAEEGLQAKAVSPSAKDSQAVEARKLQVEEIGRFTGVPRPLLMVDETSWGSGIEQLGLFFITYCLGPWFIVWEEAIARTLLTEAEGEKFFAKFNEGALLRGSLKDQAEFFTKALGSGGAPGWLSQNEVRDLSHRPPIEGGDEVSKGSGAAAASGGEEGNGDDQQGNSGQRPPQPPAGDDEE